MAEDSTSQQCAVSLAGPPLAMLQNDDGTTKQTGVGDFQRSAATQKNAFRFRDLPEELQALIIQKFVPVWSIRLVPSTCSECKKESCLIHYRIAPKQIVCYVVHRVPNFYNPLLLVDKYMFDQATSEALKKFTGKIHTDYIAGSKPYYDHIRERVQDDRQAKKEALSPFLTAITAMQPPRNELMDCDTSLVHFLPNLRVAIGRTSGTLFDGYIYGFGSQEYLIRNITEGSIQCLRTQCMFDPNYGLPGLDQRTYKLQLLWQAGITTILEMDVGVGAANMKFRFVCVYRIEMGETSQLVYIPLGRFAAEEWSARSQSFKMSIYAREPPKMSQ